MKKKNKKSFWKFYLVVALFPFFTGCSGCIQLTGCNIDLGDPLGQQQAQEETKSLVEMISSIGE